MNQYQLITFSLVVVAALISAASGQENAIDNEGRDKESNEIDRCVSGWECRPDECSVMGMQRYSEPACRALGDVGQPCIPFAKPGNKTLHYPHVTKRCEQVYTIYCPCAEDLVCDTLDNRCKRPSLRRYENPWSMARLH